MYQIKSFCWCNKNSWQFQYVSSVILSHPQSSVLAFWNIW